MQRARGDGRGVARGPGRRRLDRRHRRAARRRRRNPRASPRARGELREYGQGDFSEAIRTTDKFAKEVEVDVALPSGTVRLTAQAKGAAMISPSFATMLCFIQTDAALAAETADLLLGVCVARSFRPGVRRRTALDQRHRDPAGLRRERRPRSKPQSEDEVRFGDALDWALRKLALDIVRDGEGSKRTGRVVVSRGRASDVVAHAARAVANSPLVKAALHGGDPNWGRIAQAVGARAPRHRAAGARHLHRGRAGLRRGRGDALRRRRAGRGGGGRRGRVHLVLPGDGAEAEVFLSTSRTTT